jgi:SAM-dependent methyltransferase
MEDKLLRLDLGCGTKKKDGYIGIDSRQFDGVDQVVDLSQPWPWADDSVDEVNCAHLIEHLNGEQRIHFVNELYRVLKKGAKAFLSVPHWASQRAYGDLSHQWPPVSEFWFYYLNAEWRKVNAPHNDFYKCDFEATWGYFMRPDVSARNQEFQQFAMANYKEACMDTIATLAKK